MMFFGIDLGTTNSLITFWVQTGETTFDIKPIKNNKGSSLTPSVVYFEEDSKKAIVGTSALDNYDIYPHRTVRWVKREMGKDFDYEIDSEHYSPQEISAFILRTLKEQAEKDLQYVENEKIENIVITVPADFDDKAKQATVDAARIAGFVNIHLIAEPNAALLNYIFRTREVGKLNVELSDKEIFYIVFDLGGGTFDVSLSAINLDEKGRPNTRVISSSGDKFLGGINFDRDLMMYILNKAKKLYPDYTEYLDKILISAKHFIKNNKANLDEDIRNLLARLIKECELGKEALTDESKKTFFIPTYVRSFKIDISREEFEGLLQPYIQRMQIHIETVLKEAVDKSIIRSWEDLKGVILVGGSTNIPIIKDFCKEVFGMKPIEGVDTFESVAKGASIYSAIKNGHSEIVGDYKTIIPHNYGLIHRGVFVPVLLRGQENDIGRYQYEIPFSLDTKTPIEIIQKYRDEEGRDFDLTIEKINYSHPFMYTGDRLDITFDLDDNLILTVKVKEPCVYDAIELTINDSVKLSDDELMLAINKLSNTLS